MKPTSKRQIEQALRHAAFFAAYVCAFVFVWLICQKAVANEYLLPPLKSVFLEIGALMRDSFFYSAFFRSMIRVLRAFIFSFLFASVCAVGAYLLPLFEKILAPVVAILRALPTMAVILIILIFSTPDSAPVVVAFLALFPVLYTGLYGALSAVDHKLVEACKVYRVPLARRIFKLYLPLALPQILRQASSGVSFAIKLVVSAEVIASTFVGVGGMIGLSKAYFEIPKTFALTLLVVAVGLIVELVGIWLSRLAERRTS